MIYGDVTPKAVERWAKRRETFWAKVDRSWGPKSCWPWRGKKNIHGYGETQGRNGGTTGAHRMAYTLAVGKIQPGMEIDHLCRNRLCCNPDHLEQVSGRENRRRAGLYNYIPAGFKRELGPNVTRTESKSSVVSVECRFNFAFSDQSALARTSVGTSCPDSLRDPMTKVPARDPIRVLPLSIASV